MHLKTALFSPKLDMQSYPVTLKNGKCPPKHYISILMMDLCKFGHNISTRCSDNMPISFFLPWVGYFGIVLGMEKYSHMCISMFQVFGVHIVSFGSSQ